MHIRVSFPILVSACTVAVALLVAIATSSAGFAADAAKPLKEKLIERLVELPDKHFNILVRTVEWPVGYKSKPHTHAGPGPRYVLSGKVRIDDAGTIGEYEGGQSFWHAGGFPHTAENIASTPSKVLIIELLPKPLNQD